MMRVLQIAIYVVAVLWILFIVWAMTKRSYAHDWMEGYRNSEGTPCCRDAGPGADCAAIPNEIAWTARVGSIVEVPLLYGPRTTTINTVHPSQDPNGRSFACTTGCLLRSAGL